MEFLVKKLKNISYTIKYSILFKMKKIKNIITIILFIIYIITGIYLVREIISNSGKHKELFTEYTENINFQSRIFTANQWFNGDILFKINDTKLINIKENTDKSSINDLKDTALEYLQKTKINSQILFCISFIFLIIIFLLNINNFRKNKQPIFLTVTTIALVFLIIGIFSPALEIKAYSNDLKIEYEKNDIEFKLFYVKKYIDINFTKTFNGETYFYYQNKSIYEIIEVLFKEENYIVGISLLLFSVIIPFLKLVLSIVLYFSKQKNKITFVIVKNIGKWSMADVFVAALFLAYLSFNNMASGVETESNVLYGLYFFLGYVILSIISTFFLINENSEIKTNNI